MSANLKAPPAPFFHQHAAAVKANGYDPIPLPHGEKGPNLREWQKYQLVDSDVQAHAFDGVGILTARTPAIDIDVRDAAIAAELDAVVRAVLRWPVDVPCKVSPIRIGLAPKMLRPCQLEGAPFKKKKTAGYRLPGDAPGDKPHHVEILGDGQQFVAYNVHPDTKKPYTWKDGDPTQILHGWLPLLSEADAAEIIRRCDEVLAKYGTPVGPAPNATRNVDSLAAKIREAGDNWFEPLSDQQKESEVRAIVATWTAEQATDRDAWFKCIRSIADAIDRGLDRETGIDIAEEFSQRTSVDNLASRDAVEAKMFEGGHKSSIYAAAATARKFGYKLPPDRVAPPPPLVPITSGLVDSNGEPLPAAGVVAVDQVMLADQFTKTKGGVIHGSVRNAVAYLTGVSRMSEVFFDEFSQRIYFEGQEWSALNETPLLLAIQTTAPAISPDTFARAVEAIALSQRRDRLKDWINTLPAWDGERRLSCWLRDAFGCPTDRYHLRVARNWLISMIARGLVPGCKVDTVPVLEGLQGKKKSSALEALSDPFFVEAPHVKFGDKDFLQCLQGAWLIELPELSSLRSADVDSIKAEITKKVDRYRAPYARRPEDHPRRFVWSGTVNESDYLRDTTGNRRFLPVDCKTVNLQWIKANRDQLLAEALSAFKAGRNWWTFPSVATAEMQDSRLPSDPWASLVSQWMAANPAKSWITSDELHAAVGVPMERRNRTTEMHLGKIMRKSFPQWLKTRLRLPGNWQQLERGWALQVPPPPAGVGS